MAIPPTHFTMRTINCWYSPDGNAGPQWRPYTIFESASGQLYWPYGAPSSPIIINTGPTSHLTAPPPPPPPYSPNPIPPPPTPQPAPHTCTTACATSLSDSHKITIHRIRLPPNSPALWSHPGQTFDFDVFSAPASFSAGQLIEQLGGKDGAVMTEALERGDGRWEKGISVTAGTKGAKPRLDELGWRKEVVVWVVLVPGKKK